MVFLAYLLKSSVCVAILWIAYHALLRKETHYAFNRFYLLSVIPLSSIIPLLRLPLLPPVEVPSHITIESLSAEPLTETATQSFSIATLLLIIYFSGAGFVAFRFIKQLYHMHRVMAASRFSDTKNYSAFTFFRKIYINRHLLPAGDYEKILWHEQVHARQLHSIDLVVVQLFLMFQWFNPLAWCLKKSIVATHEYLADAQVLAHGVDVNIYQQLLFHQTTGAYPEYAHGFSYSLTKKRLIMMTKNNTGKFFALKLCGLLPALALPVALFGLSTAETVSPVNPEKTVIETVTEIPDTTGKKNGTITVYMKSGVTLVFGSDDVRLTDISPENISSISVQKDEVLSTSQGKKDGTITIQMKSGETLVLSSDDERLKDISPENISSITIQKDTAKKKMIAFTTPKKSTEEKLYLAGEVDVSPEFPGGQAEMMKFIFGNLKYPKEAADKKIQGRVTVQFTVKADGNIDDVSVLRGVDPLLDAEATRVIKTMPAWTPGKHKGKIVAVRFLLPIVFQLKKEPETK